MNNINTEVIFVTVPDQATAKSIAKILVADKLVACVNVIPSIESIYFWENKIQEDSEALMIMKSLQNKREQLEHRLNELHPYEVPEFVSISPEYVSEAYQKWLGGYLN